MLSFKSRAQPIGLVVSLLLGASLAWTPARAIDTISIHIADQQGAGWRASGINAKLDLAPNAGTSEVRIAQLKLPQPIGSLHNLSIHCPKLKLTSTTLACGHARLHLPSVYLDSPDLIASLRYDFKAHQLTADINRLALAGGHANVNVVSAHNQWRLTLHGRALAVKKLRALAAHFMRQPPQLSLTGKTTFRLVMHGQNSSPTAMSASITLDHLGFSGSSGNFASSGLRARIKLAAHPAARGWAIDTRIFSRKGEAYVNPIYLNLETHPLLAAVHGIWNRKKQSLNLRKWSVDQNGVIRMHGNARLRLKPTFAVNQLKATLANASFPSVYTSYAAPFLIGTSFDSMSTSGAISGTLAIKNGALQNIALNLHRVSFDDKQHRLGLHRATGSIRWRSSGSLSSAPNSTLAWQSGNLLHIAMGKTRLMLKTAGNGLALSKPARVPLFDGALDIHKLHLKHLGTPKLNILFDATLLPISMPKLSQAFGWLTLGGTLAGRVPTLSYKHGLLTLGGALLANLFDGSLAIRHLRLDRPFSTLPTLSADVQMRRMNLKTITHTFSFGEIQGLLNGDINNLKLVDWSPVRFNAKFYTAKNDPNNHVISQRALQNITNLGGSGPTGMIARSFIGLFSNFGYDRIGFSCRLKRGICKMGGLSPAQNGGYYMVTGAGLPQVNVIGHSRAISWPTLVSELKNTTLSASPVVK